MRLYLVRHPKPEAVEDICYGSTDVQTSVAAETEVFERLCQLLPGQVPVYTSPLSRCANLATRLAHKLSSAQPIVDSRLAELHFGTWEMQAWNQISREEIDAWVADLIFYRSGGGENVLEAAQRIKAFYDDLPRSIQEAAIVICHAGTIRLLLACLEHQSETAIAYAAASQSHRIGYGELLIIDC